MEKSATEILEEYKKLTSRNDHTEAGIVLAKYFGAEKDVNTLKKIQKAHEDRGYITRDELVTRDEISNKYYYRLKGGKKMKTGGNATVSFKKGDEFIVIKDWNGGAFDTAIEGSKGIIYEVREGYADVEMSNGRSITISLDHIKKQKSGIAINKEIARLRAEISSKTANLKYYQRQPAQDRLFYRRKNRTQRFGIEEIRKRLAKSKKYWGEEVVKTKEEIEVLKTKLNRLIEKERKTKYNTGGGVEDTVADRYARLTKKEAKRLDELQKKVDINEQTELEDAEFDRLVHKYRGWDYKKEKGGNTPSKWCYEIGGL